MRTKITRACGQSGWRSAITPRITAFAYITASSRALASGTIVHVNHSSLPGASTRLTTAATAFTRRNSSTNFTHGPWPALNHALTRI